MLVGLMGYQPLVVVACLAGTCPSIAVNNDKGSDLPASFPIIKRVDLERILNAMEPGYSVDVGCCSPAAFMASVHV